MAQFSVHDAKTNLSRLIAEALAGGDVVIARGSVPVCALCRWNRRGVACLGRSKARSPWIRPSMRPCPTTNWTGGISLEATA